MSRDKSYWKQVLADANEHLAAVRDERQQLEAKRTELNGEIIRLEQLIASLTPLASEPQSVKSKTFVVGIAAEMGLTEACRAVFRKTQQSITARRVRDMLESGGYDLEQHRNPLASIHGVLKRLEESGEVERMENNGKTFYRWIGEKRTPVVRMEIVPPTISGK